MIFESLKVSELKTDIFKDFYITDSMSIPQEHLTG